jgi:dTDP-4-amino-4,6-dideoxygalactose transaminase
MSETYYRELLTGILKNPDIFYYWKGRVALYALLKSMGIGKGDEIVMPGFTCVVVANAIKYLGAKPVYIDVEHKTMNPSFESYKLAVTSKTRVILVQNTFGLSSQVDVISDFAKLGNIYTIEDCTHGFGGSFKGRPNGSYCDAAFYSTQWNKPFSTGIGGFAQVNNKAIIPDLMKINQDLIKPGFREHLMLSALLFSKDYLVNSSNYWKLRSLYRILSKHNLVIGSSQGIELNSVVMPGSYFKGISKIQINKGIKNLKTFDQLLKKRKSNAGLFTRFLLENHKYHVSPELHPDHAFLKYPVLVKDRQLFDELAIKSKIELGDWFCSPLYPVKKDWEQWDLVAGSVPNALYLSQHIENLPTEADDPQKVIAFLKDNINELI